MAVGLTSDSEQGLVTITCVSNVFGYTAINSTVFMTNTGYLQNAIGQESIPAEREPQSNVIQNWTCVYVYLSTL